MKLDDCCLRQYHPLKPALSSSSPAPRVSTLAGRDLLHLHSTFPVLHSFLEVGGRDVTMQQFSCFLYANALVYNRGKHLAFSSHLVAQQPIIWCLLMHQKGYKAAVKKVSPLSKTLERKKIQAQRTYQLDTRFLANCNGKVTTVGWSLFWESPAEASIWGEEPSAPSDVLVF